MTANSLGQTARRAFYEAMKGGAHSDALWEAAAGAVAEECAKALDTEAAVSPFGNTYEAAAASIRALRVDL